MANVTGELTRQRVRCLRRQEVRLGAKSFAAVCEQRQSTGGASPHPPRLSSTAAAATWLHRRLCWHPTRRSRRRLHECFSCRTFREYSVGPPVELVVKRKNILEHRTATISTHTARTQKSCFSFRFSKEKPMQASPCNL